MINIKNQKGSITLLVLTSCLFFVVAVTTVGMHMQAKQVAVDREYKQVKASYEKDLANAESIYDELEQLNNLEVEFSDIKIDEDLKNISIKATIDMNNLDVNTIKYGWLYNEQRLDEQNIEENLVNQIDNWYFLENTNGETTVNSTRKCTDDEGYGYYYFCFVVNNKIKYKEIAYL